MIYVNDRCQVCTADRGRTHAVDCHLQHADGQGIEEQTVVEEMLREDQWQRIGPIHCSVLIGVAMKRLRGRGNPAVVREMILDWFKRHGWVGLEAP